MPWKKWKSEKMEANLNNTFGPTISKTSYNIRATEDLTVYVLQFITKAIIYRTSSNSLVTFIVLNL